MRYTPIVNSNILKVKNPFDLLGGIEFNLFSTPSHSFILIKKYL